MPKMRDLTGQRFGRLTVLHRVEPKSYPIYWVCRCDCGEIKNIMEEAQEIVDQG